MSVPVREHVAASDCEEIRAGWMGQPANTISSLAFVVAAAPVVARGARAGRWPWIAVGVATALAGIGSVGYHGPGDRASKIVHDLAIDAVALSMAGATALVGNPRRFSLRTALLAGGAVAIHQLSQTGRPLCSCRSRLQGHAIFHVVAAAAIVSAVDDQLRDQLPQRPTA